MSLLLEFATLKYRFTGNWSSLCTFNMWMLFSVCTDRQLLPSLAIFHPYVRVIMHT